MQILERLSKDKSTERLERVVSYLVNLKKEHPGLLEAHSDAAKLLDEILYKAIDLLIKLERSEVLPLAETVSALLPHQEPLLIHAIMNCYQRLNHIPPVASLQRFLAICWKFQKTMVLKSKNLSI